MAENEPTKEGAAPSEQPEQQHQLVHPTMIKFMYGQFANLFKFALWWTTLAPLTYSLMNNDASAIGVGRIVYNTALCVFSPIGGILCERLHPRTVLLGAASVRFAIWCILVPLMWFFFDSSIVLSSQTAIWILFNVLLVFDGVSVAVSSVLDIDLCGVDIVAGRFGYTVTDEHRNQFNARQELFFAICFVIFTPGMAFAGLAIHEGFQQVQSSVIPEPAREAATLSAIFMATFLIATILQFYFFRQLPDDGEPSEGASPQENEETKLLTANQSTYSLDDKSGINHESSVSPPAEAVEGAAAPEGPPPSFWQMVKSIPSDLWEGLKVILQNPPILFRLVLLGLEIAFEDAAIVVLASQMGIELPWLGDGDGVRGNIWTAVGVASGKLGGALASFGMIHYYHPPENPWKFLPIFFLVLLSCCTIFVLPATVYAYDQGSIDAYGARALYLVTFFVYFFLSTLPKLGFMCLFQSMVSQVDNGPRVFGFIAIIATSFDALIVMGLSVIFEKRSMQDALWITAFVYLGHGVLEMVLGPLLVLKPMEEMMEKKAAMQQAADEAAAANQTGEGQHLEASKPIAVATAEDTTSPTTGMYTPRAASLQHRDHATGADRSTHLSTSSSHVVAFGSVRRSSTMMNNNNNNNNSSYPLGSSSYVPVRTQEEEEGGATSPRPAASHQLGLTPRYGGGLAGSMPMGRSYTRSGSRLGSSRRFAAE